MGAFADAEQDNVSFRLIDLPDTRCLVCEPPRQHYDASDTCTHAWCVEVREEPLECAICLDDIHVRETALQLQCEPLKHTFHADCFRTYLEFAVSKSETHTPENIRCPLCRSVVLAVSAEESEAPEAMSPLLEADEAQIDWMLRAQMADPGNWGHFQNQREALERDREEAAARGHRALEETAERRHSESRESERATLRLRQEAAERRERARLRLSREEEERQLKASSPHWEVHAAKRVLRCVHAVADHADRMLSRADRRAETIARAYLKFAECG